MSVCWFVYGKLIQKNKKYVCQNLWAEIRGPKTRMLKVSFGRLKPICDTRVIHFYYELQQFYHGQKRSQKKVHLEIEKLKANRASETEEQRKERLRLRHEKDRARRRLRNTNPRLELRSPHNISTFYPSRKIKTHLRISYNKSFFTVY